MIFNDMKTSVLPCLPTLRGFVGKLLLFTLLACVGFAQVGKAVTYTWVGSLGTNWAAGGNWSPTAPLGGPTSGDNVIFNNANSCGITSPVTVNSITLASTYTGVLTLSTGSLSITGTSGLTVAGGTFSLQITAVAFSVTQIIQTGGSIDLSSLSSLLLNSLNILGGYFYCPTNANLFINGNVIINTAFFFNQGSTIIMQGSGNSTLTIANNVSLYNLTISKPVGNSVTLSSGSTLNIFPELKISSGTFDAGLGTIKTNIFTQATNTTFTAPSGTMRVSGNFSVNSNNFMPNGGTIEFNTGGDGLFDYIVGGNQLNDVTINKTFGAKLTINSNMVLRNLYLQNGGFVTNSSQAVTAIGNVRIDQNFIYDLNNPKLIFQGGVSQSFSPVGSVTRSYGGIIEMNNSNGITIGYNGTGGKLKIENEFKFLASGKVLLGDDLIFGTSATISNANNSRYFVTTGAGNLLKNYSATPTLFNFPVGSATRYAPIGIKPSGATDISVSYQPSPTNLPENTMKTNASNTLVRRSINEVWECTSTNNIDIEPYMYVTNAAASGISNTSNLDIAIKITGSNWFSFQSEDDGKYTAYSAAPIPLVGLPLPTLYGFGDAVNVGTSFYLTFGSRTTTDNFLGTSSPRITNCKDAIPVALNTDVNTLVPSGYLAGVSAVSCYVSTVVASQWYEVVGTGQTLALTYQNTSSFTTLEVFSGGCDVLAPVGCGTATTFMAGAYINLYFNTNAGETYKIRLATTSPTSTGILRIAPAPTPVITAPVLGDATQTSFTAKWSAISGASDYQIDVSTSTDFSSPIVNGAPTLGNTNFNIIGLAAGNTYYYRVRAMFGTIASANSSVQNITLIPQSPVLSMSGYTNTNASFVVDFTGSTGATEYLLTVTDQLTMLVFGTYTLPNANLFTVSGLTPNRSYEIAVQSRNAMGTSPIPSSASRATLPNPPVNLNYTATNNSLTLTWDAPVGGAFNYDVSTDGGSSFPSFTSNGTTLTITITGLSPSTFYSVIVRSRTQQGFVAGTNAQNIIHPQV